MEYLKNEINIGISEPFTVLHISDVHFTRAGILDGVKLRKLAKKRTQVYPQTESVLEEVSKKASESNSVIIITGDMMDFVSRANLREIKKFTQNNDCIFVAGNHDFRPFGGMGYDVPKSREKTLSKVQSAFKNDIEFSSRIINGVNFVAIDDVYYKFNEEQFERLKKEVEKGFPVILLIHVPLYTEDLYNLMVTGKRNYASLISVPEEKLGVYPESRYKQQKEDDITHEVFEYIKKEESIKAILTGHVHKNFETVLDGRIPQYITGIETIREICVK